MFSQRDYEFFCENGYFIARGLVDASEIDELIKRVNSLIDKPIKPYELEAELQYEGAPQSTEAEGGGTIRRFLQMHQRDPQYSSWLKHDFIVDWLKKILSAQAVCLVSAHHNSLMTKQPKYSSATHWHRDVRYWHYRDPNLVSVWLAFGREYSENGGLKIIPGTHNIHFDATCYDDKKFFRQDLPANQLVIERAIDVDINQGDVLFFHARLLHAANANRLGEAKISLVYTVRDEINKPIAGTRSDQIDVVL